MKGKPLHERWDTEKDESIFIIKADGSEWEITPDGQEIELNKDKTISSNANL